MPPATQLPLPLPAPQPGAERGDSLPDRLCALLARRGRPLEVGHVASQLLRLRGCPERLQRRLVAEIVEGDARLAWLGRDLVGLAPSAWSRAELATTTFCVVNLETTGGSPGYSKVTEIGAVRVEGGRVGERYATLVDPGRPIPAIVTELTGIDDEMVEGSPDIETALAGFVAFAGHDVLVAHNAPFDLRFLNYERRRLAGRYFTQPWLDTLTLARRLLNGRVPRHDLGTLAVWADTTVRPMHRALPDAEATAEVLLALLELLDERGIDSLERAVAFAGAGGARHAHKLALADDLPAQPGVYLMRDHGGGVLYVGKATNLRRRVRSYFGPGGRHGRLIGRALEELESLDHETCGSEFAALLREDRLIKELRPPCNRRGAGGGGAYLKLTLAEDSPRLYAVRAQLPDGAAYFGPVRSQRLARGAVTALRLLYGVEGPDTGRAADAVRRLLSGEPASLADLGRRLAAAVHEGRLAVERRRSPLPGRGPPGHPRRPRPGAPRAGQPRGPARARGGGGLRRGVLRRRRGGLPSGSADGRVVAGAGPARAGDRPAGVAAAAAAAGRGRARRARDRGGPPARAGRRGGDARAHGRLDHRIGARRHRSRGGRAGRDAGLAVRAAAALALSGRYAPFGRQAAAGLRAWAVGCGARLRIEDDRSDPAESARLLPGLARAADLAFGPYGSGPARRAAEAMAGRPEVVWNHGGAAVPRTGARMVDVLGPAGRYWRGLADVLRAGRRRPGRRRGRARARRLRPGGGRRGGAVAGGGGRPAARLAGPRHPGSGRGRRRGTGRRGALGGGRRAGRGRPGAGAGARRHGDRGAASWCAAWPSPARSWATP